MGGGKKPPKGSISLRAGSAGNQLLGSAAKAANAAQHLLQHGPDAHQPQQEHPPRSDDERDDEVSSSSDDEEANEQAPPSTTVAEDDGAEKLAPPPVPVDAEASLRGGTTKLIYSCRKCRMDLLTSDDVVPHSDDKNAKGHKGFMAKQYLERHQTAPCSSLFLDPDVTAWLGEQVHNATGSSGDLVCPGARCGNKIGSWSWIGSQCSCGQWVNPSFKVTVSRLDAVAAAPSSTFASVNNAAPSTSE